VTIRSPLLSCPWLHANLHRANLVILDATFFLPRQQRNAYEEYQQMHIPQALFFDIDLIADPSNPLPHTLPKSEDFAAAVGRLGVGNKTKVVIYDNNGFFAAARVWWMFRVFGHADVYVLDGGLSRWKALGLELQPDVIIPLCKTFTSQFRTELYCDLTQMKLIQRSATHQILDSRSADSFMGLRANSDVELRAGHIPGSLNLPYSKLRDPATQCLLKPEELVSLFNSIFINLHRPIITTCGSAVSAAVLALSLYTVGKTDVPIYDGSWAEWGRQPPSDLVTNF
jgi:thiosulfate/3-mercaptopyruvate sulfurtransferase